MKKQSATRLAATLIASAFAVFPAISYAQTPSSAQPGVIMRGLEQQNRGQTPSESVIIAPRDEQGGSQFSTKKQFVLKEVVLDKPNIYAPDVVRGMYDDMVGETVSMADLNEIAQRLTRKYREDGYIFSRAVLPPQKITNGVVHLRAVEGRIANVKLVGNFTDKNGLIQRFADQISTSRAANAKEIERYLLLINDLPGISAKSFIQPSREAGGGDLIIDVQEDKFEGSVGIDNRGSEYIGPYRGTLVGAFNDLLGYHDRTTLRGIVTSSTKELRFGDITHEQQICDNGARLTARAAFTSTNPGGNIAANNIHGTSQMFDLEGLYPVIRSRQYNFNLIGGINALNSETEAFSVTTAEDKVRSLRLGTRFDLTDSLMGVNQVDFTVTQGLSGLGATSDGLGRSRASGRHNFMKSDATVTRVQQLPSLWSVMLSGTGQVSSRPLLVSEQFSIGGPSFGRGFDDGEVIGDEGYAGVAELRYGGPVDNQILQSYQAYAFTDYGRVTNKVVAVGEDYSNTLTSAGFGVRVNFQQDFSGYVELAKPMSKAPAAETDKGSRLFFNVLKRF